MNGINYEEYGGFYGQTINKFLGNIFDISNKIIVVTGAGRGLEKVYH